TLAKFNGFLNPHRTISIPKKILCPVRVFKTIEPAGIGQAFEGLFVRCTQIHTFGKIENRFVWFLFPRMYNRIHSSCSYSFHGSYTEADRTAIVYSELIM